MLLRIKYKMIKCKQTTINKVNKLLGSHNFQTKLVCLFTPPLYKGVNNKQTTLAIMKKS